MKRKTPTGWGKYHPILILDNLFKGIAKKIARYWFIRKKRKVSVLINICFFTACCIQLFMCYLEPRIVQYLVLAYFFQYLCFDYLRPGPDIEEEINNQVFEETCIEEPDAIKIYQRWRRVQAIGCVVNYLVSFTILYSAVIKLTNCDWEMTSKLFLKGRRGIFLGCGLFIVNSALYFCRIDHMDKETTKQKEKNKLKSGKLKWASNQLSNE